MSYTFVYQEWDILKGSNKMQEELTEKNSSITNSSINRPSFGFMLQRARIRKRMTTVDVATALKIHAKTISLFESGAEIPTEQMTKELNALLDL